MPAAKQSSLKNRLLRAMTPEAFEKFAPHLRPIELSLKQVLVDPGRATDIVCFVETGLVSVVVESPDNESIEIGHIGLEGVTGSHLALMVDRTPTNTFVQVAGTGYDIPGHLFVDIIRNDARMQQLFLNYVHTASLQLAHSALANGRYSLYERLARGLLMCHDRLHHDDLPLTHEFLGLMLGVRRSGVTDQIHMLEGAHVIRATRRNIRILDRPKLEEIAGGSYGVPEREYDRLIGSLTV